VLSAVKTIGILTSGGDAPGMNAAIRAATLLALGKGVAVKGIAQGYRGLIAGDIRPLGPGDVADIIRAGGTILGSARSKEFRERSGRDKARAQLKAHQIDGLIVIGGNGSLAGARALVDPAEDPALGCAVVGIPASIDNDLALTGMSIGVDTAINSIVDACDKISDTASAHDRTFIVEVMGRDSGYLSMSSGIASAANAVLFRESKASEAEVVDRVVKAVKAAQARTHQSKRVLVIKAEGLSVPTERLKQLVDQRLAEELPAIDPIETRVTVLGHVIRGGRPSAFDRVLASRLAHVAVRALLAGGNKLMAAWGPWIDARNVPGERAEADPHCWLVDFDTVLAETEKLLDGSSPRTQWRAKIFAEIADVLAG
jgi:6-phosphofructokinase 1